MVELTFSAKRDMTKPVLSLKNKNKRNCNVSRKTGQCLYEQKAKKENFNSHMREKLRGT